MSSSSSSVKTNLSSTNPMPKDLDDEAKLARLPSGFKFKPTDAILIHYYLARKNLGEALPANRMKEVLDFYDHHPKKLTQDYKGYEPNHWYLFTRKCYGKEAVIGGNRAHCTAVRGSVGSTNRVRIRVAGPGFWLSTTPRSSICSSGDSTILIGCKDTWVYHEVRDRKAYRTEYKDGWVLCRIDKLQCN
ncbi:hypothetical protein MKW98_016199 [Papaver atlanticum]|uniref:NAC domain-containing protein n=1 Tax=Papaver atlanticum TaxID=357466 RepID=A0AAD4SJ67_9MAGN|nr:hypothetical protein MKW98_016199 [Papaver atlanticum]